MSLVAESDALHARVRAFAASPGDEFDALALDIARFQRRWSPGFARLCEKVPLERAESIPAVPSDAFRVTRVAVHPPELDVVRFVSSGTTAEARSTHAMRTTETYRALSLQSGSRALASRWPGPRVVVALAPDPGDPGESSLGFMLRLFMRELDGRALDAPRWLVSEGGVDVAGLRRAAAIARERGESFLVLATSFALVALLDALGGEALGAPERSLVMQTGGFKGRTREVDSATLRASVARAFGVLESQVIGEYGMTELTSQLYETSGVPSIYLPPPWLRVTAVDPVSLAPVAAGEPGLARFVDLGNVDSAVAVVTQDMVRACGDGVELLGRRAGAPPRGCSLAIEALLG